LSRSLPFRRYMDISQKIGILVAAFMLGLAFGGLSMNHIMNKLRRDILALGKIELAISGYAFLLPSS